VERRDRLESVIFAGAPVRTTLPVCLGLIVIVPLLLPDRASAQVLDVYFPPLGSGFGDLATEPAQVRALEEYMPQGLRYGPLRVDADASDAVGYDSNIARLVNARGGVMETTHARLAGAAVWKRDQVHAEISVDDYRFPSQSIQNRTNWTALMGAVHDFGHDSIGLAYTHLSLVQTPMDLGALIFSRPIPYQYDDVRLSYTATTHGRFSFIPTATLSRYNFDQVSLAPNQLDQTFRNRVTIVEGVTGRYDLAAGSQILVVLQGTEIRYLNDTLDLPTRDSNGWTALAGMDFGMSGPIRFRALVGYQERLYRSSLYGKITSPVAEAELGWTPTRLTMATLSVRHGIEDGAFENVVGFSYTSAQITVRHNYSRNVVLHANLGIQKADFPSTQAALQNTVLDEIASNQTIYTAGAGAEWMVNRHIGVTLNYTFASQNTVGYGTFPDHTILLGVRFAL
jgi:opacity protein-like surface antigen